jgi:hypothetical protein
LICGPYEDFVDVDAIGLRFAERDDASDVVVFQLAQ